MAARRLAAFDNTLPPKYSGVVIFSGAGNMTLAKIAAADVRHMEADLDACYQRTQGKRWNDVKSVIVLHGLIAEAKALPVVVEAAPA